MFTGLESPTHILLVLVLVLVLFGSRRLPDIGRSLGTGMREFKDSLTTKSLPSQLPTPVAERVTQQPPSDRHMDAV